MLRTFKTNEIRKTLELSERTWDFSPYEGEYKNKKYKLAIPSCWESHPELDCYRGSGLFETTFNASENIRLVFKGVSHTANVYLNDTFIKYHYNAYTPFDVVVKNLPDQLHELKVKVDNSFGQHSALHIENDYMTYGGITRGVELQFLHDIYIKHIFFTPKKVNAKWISEVSIEVENLSNIDITCSLYFELDQKCYEFGEITVPKNETVQPTKEFTFEHVNEWNVETPNLYLLKAYIKNEATIIDDLIERVGFREIKVDGKYILINDKKIRIKGFNRHEDYALFGCSIPYSAMIYDIHLLKDLGANSIRTSHYPNDELFLDLCDEYGILVWEEHHARGFTDEMMKNPNFREQCRICNEEMITEHYNHPSIYIWGLLNECESHTEFGAACYKEQLEQFSALDQSRPNTFASNKHFEDICFEYPTVISNNMYPLWYTHVSSDPKDFLEKSIKYANENSSTLKPFIVSEIGSGGIYGCHNRSKVKWTEEYQAETLIKQVAPILESPDCIGVYIWQFCDVRVTDGWAINRPRQYNNKGVVDEYRREKMSYYTVKELFNSYTDYIE